MTERQMSPEIKQLIHQQIGNTRSLLEAHFHIQRFLGDDPFNDLEKSCTSVHSVLKKPLKQLQNAQKRLLKTAKSIPMDTWQTLNGYIADLSECQLTGTAVAPFRVRKLAIKIQQELNYFLGGDQVARFSKKEVLEVATCAREVDRIACLYDLNEAMDQVKKVNKKLLDILNDQNWQNLKTEVSERCSLSEVVNETTQYFLSSSESRGIEIKIIGDSAISIVEVPRVELKKTIHNLLDNAIKYTGKLPPFSKFKHTWIDIRIWNTDSKVFLSIESWGTPITYEENAGNFHFKEGYRGWFVRSKGIQGTGTGLADARRFLLEYGGDIIYETDPVSKESQKIVSKKTTVTLWLPLADIESI